MGLEAWFLAIYLNSDGNWKGTVTGAPSAKECFQAAKLRWVQYWASGEDTDNFMRVACYDEGSKNRYFIRCTRYGSCTLK